MAKPNYSFEKRQRELAKKKKKEEKVKEKAERKHGDTGAEPGAGDSSVQSAGDTAPAADQAAS
jgi:hypothetical protein